jgi:predicted ferric reductase
MESSNMLNNLKQDHPVIWSTARLLAGGVVLVIGFVLTLGTLWLIQSPWGTTLRSIFSWLFATNTVQAMWYVTRSAGFAAYLLLWLSTVLGLAIPAKLFDRLLPRAATYDFHQFISLLAIGFILLHVGVLLADRYLPFSIAQILVPFISPYRPVWVGIGVFSFYLALLVTITFYVRAQIGMKAFKVIHYLSLASYLGVVIHSFFSGTDSSVPAAQWLYLSTFLVVVFLTAYWIIMGLLGSIPKAVPGVNQVQKPALRQENRQINKTLP